MSAANPQNPSDVARVRRTLDTTTPHPARRYNYLLGGKDNFAADRESAEKMLQILPNLRTSVRENRGFMRRAVQFMVGAGIRQFLDVGTGIPAPGHTHEVAQRLDPTCRVLYVDNDPVVLAHSRALLTSTPQGATAYLEADAREPEKIVADPLLTGTLDLARPVGLLLVALLHFLDDEQAHRCLSTLVDALPAGSYVAVSHATADFMPPRQSAQFFAELNSGKHGPGAVRSREQVTAFFEGLELVDPGVCPISQWRADDEPEPRPTAAEAAMYGAVGSIR